MAERTHLSYKNFIFLKDRDKGDEANGAMSTHRPGHWTIEAPPYEPNKESEVKRILIYSIYEKYNIDRSLWKNKHIFTFPISILRELLVFGEHKHIIDKIKVNNNG